MLMPLLHRLPSRTQTNFCGLVAVVALPLLFGACTQKKPEDLLASAKTYLAKNDRKAAVIQIKNAIQADPESGEARFLLGTALLADGDPAQADLELRKASRLGFSQDQVVPALATDLLQRGLQQKLVDEFAATTLGSAAARAQLSTSLATAYAALGDMAKTQSALTTALSADPTYVPALAMRARVLMSQNDSAGALAVADGILRASPDSAEGWKLKGDLDFAASHDVAVALTSYRKAVAAKPDLVEAHLAIVKALLQTNKVEDAAKEVVVLKGIAPNDPQVRYFDTAVALAQNDLKTAQSRSAQLLKTMPNSVPVLLLASSVELATQAVSQAQLHLARALELAPGNTAARRLLMTAHLRAGQPAQALAVLYRGHPDKQVDPALYAVAGDAYLQSGDAKTAETFFAKASKVDPSDVRMRTSLAVARVRSGEEASGLLELQQVAEADTGGSADLALITAYIAGGRNDKAAAAVDSLGRKQPDQPLAPYLRGLVRMSLSDPAGARQAFDRALSLSPKYFPAVASLTALDLADNKLADAKARLVSFLVRDPGSSKALMALAEVSARSGASREETVAAIGKAITADPTDPAPRLMLVDFHARAGETKQALAAAQSGAAALPDDPKLLDALGRMQLQGGDFNQAIASYGKAADLQPGAVQPYLRLASAQLAAKSSNQAVQSLEKAIAIQPDLVEAQRGLAGLYVDSGRVPDALKIARTIQAQRPKESAGYALEGDIDAFGKDPAAAVAAYRAGLKQAPSTDLAVKLHALLDRSTGPAEAERFASEWQKKYPKDTVFLFHLGDAAVMRKDLATARSRYAAVVAAEPDNAPALNNLAWLSNELHLDGAIALAEKANKLAPDQASFMDTLALALGEAKRYGEAIKVQQKALTLQPNDPNLRLSLAKLYLKSGDKGGARSNLDQLAALGNKFGGQAEVSRMLREL